MIVNQILNKIVDGGLPLSKTRITVPSTSFTVESGMITEEVYKWLEECEFTRSIEAESIIDGVAHDVVIELEFDDLIQLVESN